MSNTLRIPMEARNVLSLVREDELYSSIRRNSIGMSRKFWSAKILVRGTEIFDKIGPGGPIFSEKNGPCLKKMVRVRKLLKEKTVAMFVTWSRPGLMPSVNRSWFRVNRAGIRVNRGDYRFGHQIHCLEISATQQLQY